MRTGLAWVLVALGVLAVAGTVLIARGSVSDGGTVLFKSGFETGDASEWAQVFQAAPGRLSVGRDSPAPVEGDFRARFEVRPGERERWTGDSRTEVSQHDDPYRLREGMELFIRFRIHLPRGFPLEQRGWGQLVWQLHQRGSAGSPPQALIIAGEGRWALVGDESADGSRTTFWNGPPVDLERWHDFVVQIRFSRDERDGFIALWHDGWSQTLTNGQLRMRARTLTDEYSTMRFGLYRADDYEQTSVMFGDGYVVGSTLDAVGAF